MNKTLFFGNILLHVSLMALFVTIFFFTIAQKLEAQIVKDQVSFVVQNLVGQTIELIPPGPGKQKVINNIVSTFPTPEDLKPQDLKVEKSNKEVEETAYKFIGIVLGVAILLLIILAFIGKWTLNDYKFLLHSSLVGVLFVGIAEIGFFLTIPVNYISADPNNVRSSVIKTIVCNSNPKVNKCK